MRDKLKLETMSRAYGIPGKKKHRQLSPVKQRVSHVTGTTPGQPFIEDPIEVPTARRPSYSAPQPLFARRFPWSLAVQQFECARPPAQVANCDEVIISWKPPMNAGAAAEPPSPPVARARGCRD